MQSHRKNPSERRGKERREERKRTMRNKSKNKVWAALVAASKAVEHCDPKTLYEGKKKEWSK